MRSVDLIIYMAAMTFHFVSFNFTITLDLVSEITFRFNP